ncbi:MAG: hypothetical protein R3E95_16690 [Thiolinea sp.]
MMSGFLLTGQAFALWTPWFDRDNPSGVGDYETTSALLKIECRFKDNHQNITDNSHAGYHCNIEKGGWCKNNVPLGNKCKDIEVRFHYYNGGATSWLDRDNPSGVGDYETIVDLLKPQCKFVSGGQFHLHSQDTIVAFLKMVDGVKMAHPRA